MGFLDAIANLIPASPPDPLRAHAPLKGLPGAAPQLAAKPVFQFAPFPVMLDTGQYANAQSGANPDGDLRPLLAFRNLVDPLPSFSRYYNPSGNSTERTYETIINGAAVARESPFTSSLLASAKQRFSQNAFADMDGTPGQWRPVYASPDDWYDLSKIEYFQELQADLGGDSDVQGIYSMIGAEPAVQLTTAGGRGEGKQIDPATRVRAVRMKYLLVTLNRSWLNPTLFQSNGWLLSQQPSGFCSSGDLQVNSGVFPLLPTALMLARDISLDVDWASSDQAFLDSARSSVTPVSLGPFRLDAPVRDAAVQLIGWVHSLVPFSPKDSGLASGSILVKNQGAFICRFSVSWREDGRPVSSESGNFPVLAAKSIDIAASAKNILVKFDVMTFPEPFETWKTVATLDFDAPVRKCFELSGDTVDPKLTAVACAQ